MLPIVTMLALFASAVARSPATVIVACAVGLIAWRRTAAVSAIVALAGAVALLRFDHTMASHRIAPLLAMLALLIVSVVVPTLLRLRHQATPPETRAKPAPERRRSVGTEVGELETSVEQETIDRLLCDARDAIGGDVVVLWQHNSENDEIAVVASTGVAADAAALESNPPLDSLVHWTVQQRMPASNYETDRPLVITAPVGKDGRFQGALGVYAADRNAVPRERAKAYLQRYASRAGTLVDLLADGRETRRYRGKAERLARAAEHVQGKTDMVSLGEAICETALEISGGTRSAFVYYDQVSSVGSVHTVSSLHSLTPGVEVAPDSLVGIACREGQRSLREAYRRSELPLFAFGEPTRRVNSVAIVPLVRHLRTQGAMVVEGDELGQLTNVEMELLSLLGSVTSVALQNVERLEEERSRAMTDALTGVANRRRFDERLKELLGESDRFGQPVSLILADVDNFKAINDNFGHAGGDAVLKGIAELIKGAVRTIDLTARYGGEEFAILLPQTALAAACDVAERLRKALEDHVVSIGHRTIDVKASFGVASFPESVRTQDQLVSAADQALYSAKKAGRNCVRMALPKQARKSG